MHCSLLDVVYVLASTCSPGPQYGCGLQLVAPLPDASWYCPSWQATHAHAFPPKKVPLLHATPAQAMDVVTVVLAEVAVVTASVVTASSSHFMIWCCLASWCWPSGHTEQLRGPVLLSWLMYRFWSHFVCGVHDSSRWLPLAWYCPSGQGEHVRPSVLLSGLMRCPFWQNGCVKHVSWFLLGW